jgi:hypothetical protein
MDRKRLVEIDNVCCHLSGLSNTIASQMNLLISTGVKPGLVRHHIPVDRPPINQSSPRSREEVLEIELKAARKHIDHLEMKLILAEISQDNSHPRNCCEVGIQTSKSTHFGPVMREEVPNHLGRASKLLDLRNELAEIMSYK